MQGSHCWCHRILAALITLTFCSGEAVPAAWITKTVCAGALLSKPQELLAALSTLTFCAGEPLLAPQEILAALITLNPQAEGLPLKAITGALSRCFEMRDAEQSLVFHPEALASTMQQLVVR